MSEQTSSKGRLILIALLVGAVIIGGVSWLLSNNSATETEDSSALLIQDLVATSTATLPTATPDHLNDPNIDGNFADQSVTGRLAERDFLPTLVPLEGNDHLAHINSREDEFVESVYFTPDCHVQVITNRDEYLEDVEYSNYKTTDTPCRSDLRLVVPHASGAGVFEDRSQSGESYLRLIHSHHGKFDVELDRLGAERIIDMRFLEHDRVVVLQGEPGKIDTQKIKIYNVMGIASEYPDNLDANAVNKLDQELISKDIQTIILPDVTEEAKGLIVGSFNLVVLGDQGKTLKNIEVSSL